MIAIREMTIGEFGAFVSSHLRASGIDIVLTGGSCVTLYSSNDVDLDEIERWSKHEGLLDEFNLIKGKLIKQS